MMKFKRFAAFALAAALLLTLSACGGNNGSSQAESSSEVSSTASQPVSSVSQASSQPTEPTETTVTDMIGREVAVTPGSYQNVVCVGAGALRMYTYICGSDLLCGVEDIDNLTLEERPQMFDSVARPYVLAYGDAFSSLPSCGVGGPNAQTAEAEKILACGPDIVISEYEDVEKENALQEQLGVPVITLRSGPNSVFDDSFKGCLNLLGTIFQQEEKAAALIDFIDGQAQEITSRTADIAEEDKPGVYICGLGNWGTTNHLMTTENYISFQLANVKNVAAGLAIDGIQALEEEKFVDLGETMDIMIIDAAAVKNIKPLYQEDSAMFDSCKAWQNGEVYLQMAYNAYYTNYEIALMNTWFAAKTVYPDLFDDIDMTEKTNEITQAFLGQELAEEIFACPASFGGYQKIDTVSFFN